MKNIRGELFMAFMFVIAALASVVIGGLIVHQYLVDKLESVSDTTIQEYQLLNVASTLTTAYNNRYLSYDITTNTAKQQLNSAKNSINQITVYLDKAITDPESKSNYIGVKNSLNALTSEINTSLTKLSQSNISDYTTDHDKVIQLFGYVQSNDTGLIFSQLAYTKSSSANLNRTYHQLQAVGVIVLVFVTLACMVYVIRFSKRLTQPLTQLTKNARDISLGTAGVRIEPTLIARQDEIGSLSKSLSVMLERLKGNLYMLTQQKAAVEREVSQRTSDLTQEQARLTSSVQSLSLGYVMTDAEQGIILMNDAARFILSYQITKEGISEPETKLADQEWTINDFDQHFTDSFHFKEILSRVIRDKKSVERNNVEYHGRILRVFVTPIIENSAVLGTVILMEDITEEKVAERSKEEFFSIASHELRTPLTAIRGNSDMLRQFYVEKVNDSDFAEMIDDIYSSSVRLIAIVSDFLDVSRIEQGKLRLNIEAFAMDNIIENVANDMAAVSHDKQNHLELKKALGTLPQVYADKDRVKQILYNLIGNAMKYTEEGTITIECAVDDKYLKVMVSDSGPGISERNQQALFHKFQQANDNILTRDSSQSTGLGLYISRLLASKMGGEVKLERSKLGEGSTFSFTVPLYRNRTNPIAG